MVPISKFQCEKREREREQRIIYGKTVKFLEIKLRLFELHLFMGQPDGTSANAIR